MILYIRNIDYIDIFATSNKGIKNNINDISVFARSCQIILSIINLIRRDIQDILYYPGSAAPPPLPPPPPMVPPPCGGEWVWVASVPPLMRGGVVVGCFPLPVVWCGSGAVFGGSPPSRVVVWRGLGSAPPVWLDLLGVCGKPMLTMILMIIMIIIIILVFLFLVVGYFLPTCLLTIIVLLIVGPRSLG